MAVFKNGNIGITASGVPLFFIYTKKNKNSNFILKIYENNKIILDKFSPKCVLLSPRNKSSRFVAKMIINTNNKLEIFVSSPS